MDNGGFHHLWISGFFEASRPSPSLAAVVFTAHPPLQQRKPPIRSRWGAALHLWPALHHPTPKPQHLLPRQSAAKLCPSLSLGSFDMLPLCFGRKANISAGRWGGRFLPLPAASCVLSLILPSVFQVIPLQSVSHQTAATGTLWRHGRQNSRLPGDQGHALSAALQFCRKAGGHVCLFLIRVITCLITTARCSRSTKQRAGQGRCHSL